MNRCIIYQLKVFKGNLNTIKSFFGNNFCINVCKIGGNGDEDEVFSGLGFDSGLLNCNINFFKMMALIGYKNIQRM